MSAYRALADLPLQFQRAIGRPRANASPQVVKELRQQGLSYRMIARLTGFGYGTIRRIYLDNSPELGSLVPDRPGAVAAVVLSRSA
jgi:DNA invertase Pin-like site-specific DNA recombinase